MKRRMLTLSFLLALGPVTASVTQTVAQAQAVSPASAFADPQAAEKANPHEEEVYKSGTEALSNGDYDHAVSLFDEVAKMRGRRAPAALYWKAYTLQKAGNNAQALSAITELKKSYPQSSYVKDANALKVEMPGAPANVESSVLSEEEKALVLQKVIEDDPEKGIPYAEKW